MGDEPGAVVEDGSRRRRVADPQVVEMRDTLCRVEGELKAVLGQVCPLDRVQLHEDRMAAFEARATAIDTRLTAMSTAVTEVRKAVTENASILAAASATERSERSLWLDQFGKLIETQGRGITQAITLLGDRVSDQGRRIDGLTSKLQTVMETNETLLEHQTNGLAANIAQAVAGAITGEAQAHVLETNARAAALVAEADAEARKNPWLLRLLQTKAGPVPIGGLLALAALVLALAALDSNIVQGILEWFLRLVTGRTAGS